MNHKNTAMEEFGNTVVVGGVFFLVLLTILVLSFIRTQLMKVFRFTIIGIPMITGITLALFILKLMRTSLEVIAID